MVKGQKVVCINDTFPAFIKAIYKQLPVKGNTYTIREVFLGREKVVKGGDSATVGLLLAELVNPPDPFHAGQQELGFSSERFAPIEELPPEEAEEEEELHIGAGAGHGYGNNERSSAEAARTSNIQRSTSNVKAGKTDDVGTFGIRRLACFWHGSMPLLTV